MFDLMGAIRAVAEHKRAEQVLYLRRERLPCRASQARWLLGARLREQVFMLVLFL